jgi:hypothetical protein
VAPGQARAELITLREVAAGKHADKDLVALYAMISEAVAGMGAMTAEDRDAANAAIDYWAEREAADPAVDAGAVLDGAAGDDEGAAFDAAAEWAALPDDIAAFESARGGEDGQQRD